MQEWKESQEPIHAHTRGSVWLQVSGIGENAEKVQVGAFLLEKITIDLPLHPLPVAVKWDHYRI